MAVNHGNEQIRNNIQRDAWRRKAQPAEVERYSVACAAIKEVWNTGGPASWKSYELCKIKQTVPMAARFEIDWLIDVLVWC